MQPPTILVIEDQDTLRANLALLLELEGFRVVAAEDGLRGIGTAIDENPDLVLCDQMMPGLDGRGVVRALRANPAFDRTPFLFLSAKGDPADLAEARELGADGYLTKPVVRADLLGAVNRWIATGRTPSMDPAPLPSSSGTTSVSGDLRESLAILLTGTDILHRHGGALSESERLAQRDAMLAAVSRLATEMAGEREGGPKLS